MNFADWRQNKKIVGLFYLCFTPIKTKSFNDAEMPGS
jgi:hypothetical protein